jgi:hypothetical protein
MMPIRPADVSVFVPIEQLWDIVSGLAKHFQGCL